MKNLYGIKIVFMSSTSSGVRVELVVSKLIIEET